MKHNHLGIEGGSDTKKPILLLHPVPERVCAYAVSEAMRCAAPQFRRVTFLGNDERGVCGVCFGGLCTIE